MNEVDRRHMRRALALAERGRGAAEPNPLVGAVVAHGELVVGEGYHRAFGHPHAEIEALDQAGAAARGATLYVTLEPCCHHGKTPPCTDRVIASGAARVVAAMIDPFPRVAGGGRQQLLDAGLKVDVGCLEAESRRLNAQYLTLLRHGRPYVHLKWAMTADGKIATAGGQSQWITGKAARAHSHAFRGVVDGIVAGIGTVLADDSLLTARPPGPRKAARVVLDSRGRTPLASKLVQTARDYPTIIALTTAASARVREDLEAAGCECLVLPEVDQGRVSIAALLAELGQRRWTNLLVEGGAAVAAAFAQARAIDSLRIYLAPLVAGGAAAKGPVGGGGFSLLADCPRFGSPQIVPLGDDLFLCYSSAHE